MWKLKRPKIAKKILRKKENVGILILSDIQSYYKALVTRQYGSGLRTNIEINGVELSIQK